MKLIIQNDRIVATATDEYVGPEATMLEPEDFDILRLSEYRVVDGALVIPAPPVPTACTRRQGRLALLRGGHLDDVEAAIATIADSTERQAAQIEYEADTWDRQNQFMQSMWSQLGGDSAGLDDLFRLAVTL